MTTRSDLFPDSLPNSVSGEGLLLNPRSPERVVAAQVRAWEHFAKQEPSIFGPGAVGISTSGSTSGGLGSIVVLSRQALEVSARAVNRRLSATARDVWGLALPIFHVGGFSIPLRASLSDSRVAEYQAAWTAEKFHQWLCEERVTLLSLVPTQLFDLVNAELKSPPHLRALVIGGGRLDEGLYVKARALGWPVLQSYGLTECCSQVATAAPDGDGRRLEILDHVEVRADLNQKLWIRSMALLSGRIVFDREMHAVLERPVGDDGWFETSDRASVEKIVSAADSKITSKIHLKILGREGETVKVLGELVDLARVRGMIEKTAGESPGTARLGQRTWVVAIPHERRGHELVLIVEVSSVPGDASVQALLANLRDVLAPFEIPTRTVFVDEIPRSSLGKVLSSLLTERISATSR